ncbi:MAG: hypothetical protein Q4G24_08065 [Paracoccus sp. (in: a-proteobacteria)]|uniref:hypothetical protein n=1 Tax=Paracoccus sp. TaxID=267 RepID=UPI0026DF1385|nr:hypothetical protein [Paracoccus sp. (in: a-proteobacteria)]MDO5621408.1 hypothetical protein [Paracoccus sp. (in: a-proteobacteria)]
MKHLPLLTALALAPAAALAQVPDISQVLSAVQVELDDTYIGQERAVLVQADDAGADLYIFAGVPDDRAGELILHVPDLVFSGQMAGQTPWLEQAENGSLLLHAEQIGIGRTFWERTLTIAQRDGAIVVAGSTYSSLDRLSASTIDCGWNLLTGKWVLDWSDQNPDTGESRDGSDSGVDKQHITLAEMGGQNNDSLFKHCQHKNTLMD